MKQIKKSNTANYNLLPQPRMLRSKQKLRARISLEADPVEFKAKKVGRSYDFPTNQIHFLKNRSRSKIVLNIIRPKGISQLN